MKTYAYTVSLVLTLLLLACSKTTDESSDGTTDLNRSDYGILLQGATTLNSTLLSFDGRALQLSDAQNRFPGFQIPELSYRSEYQYSFYKSTGNCTGEVLVYDFKNATESDFSVFDDLGMCGLTILTMAHDEDSVFLSYMIESEGKDKKFFIRFIERTSDNLTYEDVEISMQPKQMAVSNNRLFVLTKDVGNTEENYVSVIQKTTKETIHEMNLGLDVGNMFVKPDGNIIISYPTLHTTLNASDLNVTYTRYGEGAEPMFSSTMALSFDTSQKMYYTMETQSGTKIPAVYDFSNSTAVLYYFENFLTAAQLDVEYNIESATAVGYDEKNDLILVGYKKKGQANKGGILRMSPAPNFMFMDNYDLIGIPIAIFDL
ncbi:hypothetical protein EJ994_04070 [Maribacter sp. MJ134]|uniref:hypothetical protein n=1 Tax=Maribacter sp. MJ134 TaxID=2496865 RepID=UPI000F82F1EA|nr:hypothetical protein [Maribacter sp. MJ134]AZQ58019.1 hypothetical protein EJ994_04070 [Maribacter sp. MJ134]